MMTPRLAIETPESVEFSLPLAGPGARMIAMALDLAIIFAAGSAIDKVLGVLGAFGRDVYEALRIVGFFAVFMSYNILTEWVWRGQTVGKRVMKVRVMDARGGRLEPNQIILRNILRLIDMLPMLYLLGGAVCMLTRHYQRLGDLAAGTVVVRIQEIVPPDLDQLLGGKFNSMLSYRHLAARLRNRTSPELAAAALEAVVRREQLDPQARLRVFAGLAVKFRELVTFPPEAVETLADEQYVRNAVEIVFRTSRPR